MPAIFNDCETRSTLDLKKVGLDNYSRHPTTDVWCWCHAEGDGAIETWRPGDPVPAWAYGDWEIVAHNAPFEMAIWNNILTPRYGWPVLDPERVVCTMVRGYAMAMPGKLEEVLPALGLPVRKDKEGHALMLRMCRPRSKKGQPLVWWDDAERIARLIEYCKTDVEGERQLYKVLFPLGEREAHRWQLDYAINNRGILVDAEAVRASVQALAAVKKQCDAEMAVVTANAVTSCGALAALKDWCAMQGVPVAGLAKDDIESLTAGDLPPRVRRALTLRQEASKASTAKLEKMIDMAGADGRIRNLFQFLGAAATGRWAGRAIQPHNLPRDVPDQEYVERMFSLLKAGDWHVVDAIYGSPMTVISRCLRGFIIPAPGHVFTAGDFSNVEGRGVAWFAGEDWKLEAFRAYDRGEGPDLYVATAARILKMRIEDITLKLRQKPGKIAELAFGYGGGVGAARNFGATESDSVVDGWKQEWRAEHPATRAVWRQLEAAAIGAVQNPGEVFKAGYPGREVKFKVAGSFLWCLLPSGRTLCYAYPRILPGEYGPQLTYFTVPSTNDIKRGSIIDDPANTSRWARVSTYGGSLLENVIQALCRDLLAYCIEQLEQLDIPVVLHVHDEIVCEVAAEHAEYARAAMSAIMNDPPAWAAGFPLKTECGIMTRYGK